MCTKLLQYCNAQTLEILNIAVILNPRLKSLSIFKVDEIATQLKVWEKFCILLSASHPVSDYHSESTDSTELIEVNETSTNTSDVNENTDRDPSYGSS